MRAVSIAGFSNLCLSRSPDWRETVSTRITIAVIQHPPVFLNLQASVRLASELVADAATKGAKLVVFPESWLPGYPVWLDYAPGAALWGNPAAEALFAHLYANSPTANGSEIAELSAVAAAHDVDIVMGLHERAGNTLYNSMMMIGGDGTTGIHRKLMPTHGERLIWGQGDGSTLTAWQRPYGTVGGLICWEHWMPLARAAMHAQHEAIHIAQWPAAGELHQMASRTYAFEGQCFVVVAGAVITKADVLQGFDSAGGSRLARTLLESMPDDLPFLKDGGSAVIAPDASYVVAPVYGQPLTLYAEIDLAACDHGKLYLDTHGHYARPDVFELVVNTRSNPGVRFGDDGPQG
jgi:nitrilase